MFLVFSTTAAVAGTGATRYNYNDNNKDITLQTCASHIIIHHRHHHHRRRSSRKHVYRNNKREQQSCKRS